MYTRSQLVYFLIYRFAAFNVIPRITRILLVGKPEQENLNELKQELDIDFHKISITELCQRLGTNLDTGLTNSQVKANQVG